MFMRESEGVYEFGSRRILVKVERDKIQIKVGGGFLGIDEFLDQYTPAELEKLERKDPLKKVTENNQSIDETRSVNKSVNKSATLGRLPSKVSNATSPAKKR